MSRAASGRGLRIAVVGAAGRMGGHVLRGVEAAADLSVAAALERAGHPDLGKEVSPGIALGSDLAGALAASDVAVDFSLPESTLAVVEAATPRGVGLVIGTTGFSPAQLQTLRAAASQLAIVLAPNFSLGVNVLIELVDAAARALDGYEIDVLELHHSRKVDAPSGTALRLGESAAGALGRELSEVAVYHREGHTGPRPSDAIGFQTLRLGDSPGEHTVYLAGPGERLELTHRALSRDNFAAGALRAARWLRDRPPSLYTMRDVLRAPGPS